MNISWDDAKPTKTHMGIAKLVKEGLTKFVISQNIDGLHLRSGIPRGNLAELHGNMFVDECSMCKKMFVRPDAASTVGRKISNESCKAKGKKPCRGKLRDFVLDWEDELPDEDLTLSLSHSTLSELSIVIGSTLQIIPAGNMPTFTKKSSEGKLVIINLQPTKHDKKADLIIRAYADEVFEMLFEKLGLPIPEYNEKEDPVKQMKASPNDVKDYTQSKALAKEWEVKSGKLSAKLKEQRKKQKSQTNGSSSNGSDIKHETEDSKEPLNNSHATNGGCDPKLEPMKGEDHHEYVPEKKPKLEDAVSS